ncbi:uncharacterized protein LOC110835079 isoform X2 [Zootermopsis nevadensis]|uniref:uncharacterized protein LOC110835079 isoform X2 n=1 Tax=Zootermopsis nevadensis TaxID=136037 RepID=UPI000B8EBBB3|nr:uncharacterized protein LOC110835079 isoform X2 [Zootermopsis nevadensis]
MEDVEREDLLIRASSGIELTDNEDSFDGTKGSVLGENKTNSFYDKVQFICIGLLLCCSSTAIIILLPLYLEAVDFHGDAYTAIIFTCFSTTLGLFVVSCIAGRLRNGLRSSLMPPFAFSFVLRTGVIYGLSCFLVIYSLERKKVVCHLQDPIKMIVLIFSLFYYFFFCRKMMSLEKILWSSLVIIGLFITVDYGLCDEFLCRGNERKNRNEDAGDWSWQSHVVWTLVYVVALALWSLTYTLLEGHLLMSGGSSADEFLNLTRNGLYCHFGGHDKMAHNMSNEGMSTSIYDTCHQVAIYAWPFLFAYILFVLSSVQFLIMTESAVFTVAVSTIALPLAGIWWSLFRMTASTPGLLEWFPAATGGLVCSVFGLLIVLSGMVLLCKAHFKEFRCG